MNKYYTSELHTRMLIALLKEHGIKRIVASPGTTNICFVGSVQQDPFFTIYSSVDERSAAFIACGIAAESGEAVAITCTGSTASRNYIPGLTEAYYRHLPVLAITASQHLGRAGNLYPQYIDRSQQLKDMVNMSIQLEPIYSDEDKWTCELNVNKALLALRTNGGGPVHINLVTTYSKDFSEKLLPKVKKIDYICHGEEMPSISSFKRIAILVGVHGRWSNELAESVESFCKKYDAVVLNYHAANYKGKYGVEFALLQKSVGLNNPIEDADLVIYIGSVARYKSGMRNAQLWRVSPDGWVVDSEKNLTKVFQMSEIQFFEYYNSIERIEKNIADTEEGYAHKWQALYTEIISNVSELPFSNVWVAQNVLPKIPRKSVLHMAGSNTARSWNFFQLDKTIDCYSNDGTMGIDGQISALIGESLVSPNRLHFGVAGDLTMFYDLNSLGNRHVGNNIRLLIINNGKGCEFKLYINTASEFDSDGDEFMAAAGHYGNKSHSLLRHYSQDLGFEYMSADSKDEFLKAIDRFTTPELTEKPMLFEVFTDTKDENEAIYRMFHLVKTANNIAKDMIKKVAGESGFKKARKIFG